MKSITKRGGIATVGAALIGLAGLAAMTIGQSAKPVAVVVAPGARAAVMTNSLSAGPSSTLTTATAPPPVRPASTGAATTLPSTGGAGARSAGPVPSGSTTTVSFPATIPFPPTTPARNPPVPPTSVPQISPISVILQIDPRSPKVGETVHFTVSAAGGAWCCDAFVYFNDGGPPWTPLGANDTPCPPAGVIPTSKTDLTHVFAAPGVFTIVAQADGFNVCFGTPDFRWIKGETRSVVTVRP